MLYDASALGAILKKGPIMISRSRRFVSQGSGLALTAAIAVSLTGHARHDVAMTLGVQSSSATSAPGSLSGLRHDRSAHLATDISYSPGLFHSYP